MNFKVKVSCVRFHKPPKDDRLVFYLLCTNACVRSMDPVCTSCV